MPSSPCLDDAGLTQLRYLYVDNGMSSTEVAKHLFCSESTVRKYCRELGISRPPGGNKPHELPTDKVAQIRFLYVRMQWSLKRISDYYDCSEETIRRIMKRADIPRRSRHEYTKFGWKTRRDRSC